MGKQAKAKPEAKKVAEEAKKEEPKAKAKPAAKKAAPKKKEEPPPPPKPTPEEIEAKEEAEKAKEAEEEEKQQAAVLAARAKLQSKIGDVRTGGKGTVRRKKKTQHKTSAADDKQLQAQLKRLQVNNIPGIEEVNMFKDDGSVIHFSAPKVQAAINANMYVISGHAENKQLQELLPGIINQLGTDNLMNLKRIAESYNAGKAATVEGADDDVPDIDENFEDVSKS
jgi:nascent polypeptide-associated complex subunit beta